LSAWHSDEKRHATRWILGEELSPETGTRGGISGEQGVSGRKSPGAFFEVSLSIVNLGGTISAASSDATTGQIRSASHESRGGGSFHSHIRYMLVASHKDGSEHINSFIACSIMPLTN
jgi:hypothetical protein